MPRVAAAVVAVAAFLDFPGEVGGAVDFSKLYDPRGDGGTFIYGRGKIRRYVGYDRDDLGNIYRGSHDEAGKLHGWGYLQQETKEGRQEYEGEWVHGKRQGDGVLIDDSGARFIGKFEQGLPHGLAAVDFSSPPRRGVAYEYHGEYMHGLQHGHGIIVIDDAMYMGEFETNVRSGHGVIRFADSDYAGTVFDGEMHGAGRYNSSDFEYKGQFLQSTQHGFGRFERYRTSSAYEGFWDQGKQHGCGIESTPGMLWGRNEWVGQFVAGRRGAEDESCRQEIDTANKGIMINVDTDIETAFQSAEKAKTVARQAAAQSRRITQRVAEKLKELDEAIAKERAESPPDPGDMGDPAMPNIQEAVDMTGGSPDAKVKDDDKPLSSKPPAADSRAFPDASNQRVEVEVAADGQPQP